MKIHHFYSKPCDRDALAARLSSHEVVFHDVCLHEDNTKDESAEILAVFVDSKIGAAELDRFPNLKFIATQSTGYDHIDLNEAWKRGVIISNVPTYGEHTVAEFAFALLLTVSRRTCDAYDRVSEEGSFSQEGLQGFDLKGKTIGIVGTGNIGRHVVRMAHGFDMPILAFDIREDEDLKSRYEARYLPFDDVLSQSDVITLHVPYNEHTHHMINMGNIAKIKHGAYLVNTSRGAVVETAALVKALEEGIVAGAGLDVLEEEGVLMGDDEASLLVSEHPNAEVLKTTLANHYFIDHPRVIITPHIAFNTKEAVDRILAVTVQNIKAFVTGSPQNVVEVMTV